MTSRIESAWEKVAEEFGGFCCPEHREAFRVMFYTGAMTALNEMTTWNPDSDTPTLFAVSVKDVAEISAELTLAYHAEQRVQH